MPSAISSNAASQSSSSSDASQPASKRPPEITVPSSLSQPSSYGCGKCPHHLVFVRLAHDRRLVAAVLFVLFLFVLVLFVFIRISGRHRVAHDHEGTPVDQPGGKFLGHVWGHVVAPRVWTLGDFTPTMAAAIIAPMFWPNPPAIAANPVGNSIRARPLKTASQPRTVTSTRHPFVQ